MSVIPEKNGCNVYLKEFECYVHGDSYHMPGGILIIRTCKEKIFPLPDGRPLHYEVPKITHWFGEHDDYGVLVAYSDWTYYGYKGRVMDRSDAQT